MLGVSAHAQVVKECVFSMAGLLRYGKGTDAKRNRRMGLFIEIQSAFNSRIISQFNKSDKTEREPIKWK